MITINKNGVKVPQIKQKLSSESNTTALTLIRLEIIAQQKNCYQNKLDKSHNFHINTT